MNLNHIFEEVLKETNMFGNEGNDEGPDGPYMKKGEVLAFLKKELEDIGEIQVYEEHWNEYQSGPDSLLVLVPYWSRPIIHFCTEGEAPERYSLKTYMKTFFPDDYPDDEGFISFKKIRG